MTDEKEKKMYLTKASQIEAVVDRRVEEIFVEEWKMTVRLRSLSSLQREKWEEYVRQKTAGITDLKKAKELDLTGVKVRLLQVCIVDEDNKLVFEEEDIEMLDDKSSEVIERLFDVACKMNRIGVDEVKDVEKNSDSDQ